jgi:MGT family glycosyltransferase
MARFLLAVWPFAGHVYPNIAIANALRARGHEVAFYTGAMARSVVEREAYTYFPFEQVALRIASIIGPLERSEKNGRDSVQLYEGLTNHYTAAYDQGPFARARRFKGMYHEWILGTVPQQVMDLEAVIAEWDPDVLVCDPFLWGPILVLHEIQPIPVAVFSFFAGCLLPGPDAPPFALGLPCPRNWWTRLLARSVGTARDLFVADVRRNANRVRQRYGLRPLYTSVMEFAGQMPLHLVASAPEFDYERRDLPDSVYYVGPCLWDKPGDESPPAWLDQLSDDRPVIYVTEGTAHVRAPVLLRAATQGLADLPVQVVITTGRHRDPAKLNLGPIAPNVRVERWVPHSDLFPKASVVITHGGSGTVLAALQAGLPLVVVPMQWDHLENAQRVMEAQAGLRLAPKHCTPERLRAAVEQVLEVQSFREHAQRLATAFARCGGPKRAAELLEGLGVG